MQKKRSKRYRASAELVDPKKKYTLADAVKTLKAMPAPKFDQTVTVSMKLGVDPRQSDQMVRGTCPLPHGSGKTVRVLVFATGEAAEAARAAGAEFVGYEDLIKKVVAGFSDFDVAVATPSAMAEVSEVKAGRVEFKLDKNANISVPVGKVSFDEASLAENSGTVIAAVVKSRPAGAKGSFVETITLSATMSPGLGVDPSPFLKN